MGLEKYIAFARIEIKRIMAYRFDVITQAVNAVVVLVTFTYFWRAVYGGREVLAGMSLDQMITYIFLTRVVRSLTATRIDRQILRRIRSGDIAVDLYRPTSFVGMNYAQALGGGFFYLLVIGVPILVLGLLVFGMQAPVSTGAGLVFAASTALGVAVQFGIDVTFGLITFWTMAGWGIGMAKGFTERFFSGALIPLNFFPDWLRPIADWLPFRSAVYTPIALYTGMIPLGQAPEYLAVQAAWAVALNLAAAFMVRRAYRRLEIQGG
ncbi:MAG: ABC-2 family transporter protein [bacterium]|nr:ABC-2 family transporter protein [bacterium]